MRVIYLILFLPLIVGFIHIFIIDRNSIAFDILLAIEIIAIVIFHYINKFFEKQVKNEQDFIAYINLNELTNNFITYYGQALQGTTGLVWERFVIGQKWHDWLSFSSESPTLMNFEEALVLQSDYANANDWRLPSIDELKSIIKSNTLFELKTGSQIDKLIFPSTPADFFWSSTLSSDGSKIQGICFKKGIIVEKNKNEKGYVRLVRDRSIELQKIKLNEEKIKLKEENKNEKFEIFKSKVLQKTKNLVWSRCVIGQKHNSLRYSSTDSAELMNFKEALASQSDPENTDDWRLPTIDELKSLINYSIFFKTQIDSIIFPNTPADFFWSSTLSDDGSKVKGVCFKKGIIVERDQDAKGYVRLVNDKTTELLKNNLQKHNYTTYLLWSIIALYWISKYFSEQIENSFEKIENSYNQFNIQSLYSEKENSHQNHQPTGNILISGKAKIGNVLTITNTLADVDKLGDFSYQWLRNNKEIPNSTNSTYTLIESDIGKKITVNVNYLDGEGNNESITSSATPLISNAISTEPTIGNDVLTGTENKDSLNGLDGDDILIGGLGSDTLTGGFGADTFQFNSVQDSGISSDSRDVITDFNHADKDKIDFTEITKKIPLHFIGNQPFSKTDATGEIRFDTTNHILYVSTNMDNKPEFSIEFKNIKNLLNDDFLLQKINSK